MPTKPSHPSADTSGARNGESVRATEVAYVRICQEIITMQLQPGLLINERTLGARLGIARPTLVPALHRLAETGLVAILPRRGIQIAPIDLLDVQQVFDARSALEPKIAELVIQKATQDQPEKLRELRELVEELDDPFTIDRVQKFLDLDQRFHLSLAQLCRNRFLEDALTRVWMVNRRLWHLFFQERGGAENHFLNHKAILSAIERRDPVAARQAVLEHLVSSKDLLRSGLWGA